MLSGKLWNELSRELSMELSTWLWAVSSGVQRSRNQGLQ
jgi:hypothetical protein